MCFQSSCTASSSGPFFRWAGLGLLLSGPHSCFVAMHPLAYYPDVGKEKPSSQEKHRGEKVIMLQSPCISRIQMCKQGTGLLLVPNHPSPPTLWPAPCTTYGTPHASRWWNAYPSSLFWSVTHFPDSTVDRILGFKVAGTIQLYFSFNVPDYIPWQAVIVDNLIPCCPPGPCCSLAEDIVWSQGGPEITCQTAMWFEGRGVSCYGDPEFWACFR